MHRPGSFLSLLALVLIGSVIVAVVFISGVIVNAVNWIKGSGKMREGLRPYLQRVNPTLAASLSTVSHGEFLEAVCSHYGVTYNRAANQHEHAGEIEDMLKEETP